MITKLVAHEAAATKSLLLTIFGAATLIVVGAGLLAYSGWQVLSVIGTFLLFIVIGSLAMAVQVALVVHYYRTSHGKGGYFTHSLPVRGSTIFGAKLIWATLMSVVAFVWTALAAALAIGGYALREAGMGAFGAEVRKLASALEVVPWWGWILGVLFVVFGAMSSMVMLHFSATIGSEARFRNLGLGGPVLVWFALYIVTQLLSLVSLAIPLGLGLVDGQVAFVAQDFANLLTSGTEESQIMPAGFLILQPLMTIALVWWTADSWNRRISLR